MSFIVILMSFQTIYSINYAQSASAKFKIMSYWGRVRQSYNVVLQLGNGVGICLESAALRSSCYKSRQSFVLLQATHLRNHTVMPKQYNPNNMTDLFMIMSSVELRALKPMSQTRK